MKKTRYFHLLLIFILGLVLSAGLYALFRSPTEKTEITTTTIPGDNGKGRVIEGTNTSDQDGRIQTDASVVYESEEMDSPKTTSNAAVLQWDQEGEAGEVLAAFRVYDGETWSQWVESASDGDAKDGAPVTHASLVLAEKIHKIQYRFEINADQTARISPEVDLRSATLELVDTTKGPSPTKTASVGKRLLQRFGVLTSVSAQSGDPHIITRAEWGAPEPNSSERWAPEYQRLDRVIVHHTAAATTGDSAAAVRAVWHFHANSRGWGDIGYNYLVDQSGNLFEGRYYDKDLAELNSQDVVGGHALTYNYGSSGISALGDFTNSQPSEAMMRSISNLTAFKLYRYGILPSNWQNGLPALAGHRDVNQTSCPGNLHNHLPTLRSWADNEFQRYNERPFTPSENDVVKGMNSPAVYIVQNNQLRPIGSAGHRDCFVMAYNGRMKSVSEANIASLPVGAAAGGCSPPNYTWYHPTTALQQYVLIYGGMYPVGGGDVQALNGANKARPLSDAGIQYLHDNYVDPEIPGNVLIRGSTNPAVYEATNDTLQHVTTSDTKDCLVSQIGSIKLVPDSLISTYQEDDKIVGGSARCTVTTGQIMNPDGMTVAQVVSGTRRSVGNPTIRDCIIVRTDTGTPYKVSQSVWDSFSAGAGAYCPYDAGIRFVKEVGDPTVWRVFSDGRKQHADGFCVPDPFTTPLAKYRVWVVPSGETLGHANDGYFHAGSTNCQAIT